ncbi:MAG TPA: hypothetical protein VGP15_16455 [Burkholderiales bacterium]|nr:hypothetical protein [Burkholderiales bacterium]
MAVVALVGAVWLATLSGVGAYAEKAPTPAYTAAAIYAPAVHLGLIGSRL